MTRRCVRCGYLIDGEPTEVVIESASRPRPTTYIHATDAECNEATRTHGPGATYRSRLNRYLGH